MTTYRVQLIEESPETIQNRCVLDRPTDAVAILRQHLEFQDREHFMILMLDARNAVLGIHTVSIGNLHMAPVEPREVFKAAILANASAIILAHNHPSGDPTPSPEDLQITGSLKQAGRIIGIRVLDHIVIGHGGRYVSIAERRRS